ncbi:hypothetical protein PLICRDRAFT_146256 [Plicaturopsis crispa FD-325 SS-3]|uniref:Fe2OG dioxygenase domain-containing protein n=1 Tax=Plicaturopsis crispa FD-325 SS-3 TaxID=944288 RepID=A0A0C9SL30_PLICR|nr:hypothetical protein PLICRDRAFT_146256 [Plicaturopsis crispa FD-325 SS-3]
MGKTAKNLKRKRLAQAQAVFSRPDPSEAVRAEEDLVADTQNEHAAGNFVLGQNELAITIRTLDALSSNPDMLQKHRGALKGLRRAVWDFQRVSAEQDGCVTGNSGTLTARISSACAGARWTDALVLLSEMRLRKQRPKLGALQRWVRDCDAASSASSSADDGGDTEVLRVLDAILRTTADVDVEDGAEAELHPVRRHPDWSPEITTSSSDPTEGKGLFAAASSGTLYDESRATALRALFRVCSHTPGAERKPPNVYPAIVHASQPNTVPLSLSPPTVCKHPVPHVPSAFLLTSVLSPAECTAIVTATEAVGFAPDQPVVEMSSILAHGVIWLADADFLDTLWTRVSAFMSPTMSGGEVRGLNARFRVYRYVPGAVYRPHIDGAWPKSGIDPATGEYLYDASPEGESQWSRLTFLIYLNDDFECGQTTFFLPSPDRVGVMDARPVKPRQGSVLVFPHGDTKGSLLHEGSPVLAGGKYVIRTDVLYTTPGKRATAVAA